MCCIFLRNVHSEKLCAFQKIIIWVTNLNIIKSFWGMRLIGVTWKMGSQIGYRQFLAFTEVIPSQENKLWSKLDALWITKANDCDLQV